MSLSHQRLAVPLLVMQEVYNGKTPLAKRMPKLAGNLAFGQYIWATGSGDSHATQEKVAVATGAAVGIGKEISR